MEVDKHNSSKSDISDDATSTTTPQQSVQRQSTIYLKLLIPAQLSGTIIGKGGANIARIQQEADVRIRMSKANELLPGTNERYCLISGSMEGVMQVYDFIQDAFQQRSMDADIVPDRAHEINLLVPNSTAGLVIGRGGSSIRQVKLQTGARLNISQRSEGMPERMITITASDNGARRNAFEQIVGKIAEDPSHNSCVGLNYGSHGNDVSTPMGSPMFPSRIQTASQPARSPNNKTLQMIESLVIAAGGLNEVNVDILVSIMKEHFGYYGQAAMEILRSIDTLYLHGLLVNNDSGLAYEEPWFRKLEQRLGQARVTTAQLKVPDKFVGALIGSGGRSLSTLEMKSGGATIHISPRGQFVPGSQEDRLVTIEAPNNEAVERAKQLIHSVIAREEHRQRET